MQIGDGSRACSSAVLCFPHSTKGFEQAKVIGWEEPLKDTAGVNIYDSRGYWLPPHSVRGFRLASGLALDPKRDSYCPALQSTGLCQGVCV